MRIRQASKKGNEKRKIPFASVRHTHFAAAAVPKGGRTMRMRIYSPGCLWASFPLTTSGWGRRQPSRAQPGGLLGVYATHSSTPAELVGRRRWRQSRNKTALSKWCRTVGGQIFEVEIKFFFRFNGKFTAPLESFFFCCEKTGNSFGRLVCMVRMCLTRSAGGNRWIRWAFSSAVWLFREIMVVLQVEHKIAVGVARLMVKKFRENVIDKGHLDILCVECNIFYSFQFVQCSLIYQSLS